MADFSTAFKKPFGDIKKLLIGCLLNLIPIVNLFATGYFFQVAKNTMAKKKDLPEWKDWKDLFVNGCLVALATVLYAIPAIIVGLVVMGSALFNLLMGVQMESISGGILLVMALLLIAAFL